MVIIFCLFLDVLRVLTFLGHPHELGLKIDFLSKIGLCSRSTSVTGMVYVRFSSEIGNHRP